MNEYSATGPIRLMLVDDHEGRAQQVESALNAKGYQVVCRLHSASGLLREIDICKPDLIIMDLGSPDRDILESCTLITQFNPTPIVMFSGAEDQEIIKKAIQAGVSAYRTEGLDPARVQAVLEVAIAQFQAFQALREALADTQTKLAIRSATEQAKGLLMAHQGLEEQEAHNLLQKLAMQQGQRIDDVARQVIQTLSRRKSNGVSAAHRGLQP